MNNRTNVSRILMGALLAAIVLAVLLLASGYRLLVGERLVKPGDSYFVEGWGDVGKAGQASLVCRYFTGRSVLPSVYWYSPNNIMGRDSCAFLIREGRD